MRTHREIVQAHGASALFQDLTKAGFELSQSTPQRWADRDSIPGEYWKALASLKIATLEELAKAADKRRAKDDVTPEARP